MFVQTVGNCAASLLAAYSVPKSCLAAVSWTNAKFLQVKRSFEFVARPTASWEGGRRNWPGSSRLSRIDSKRTSFVRNSRWWTISTAPPMHWKTSCPPSVSRTSSLINNLRDHCFTDIYVSTRLRMFKSCRKFLVFDCHDWNEAYNAFHSCFFQTRRLRESEERYERRESLPEDLDAIAQLKELVRERESQIHKLVVSNVVCVVQFVNERNEIDRRQTTKTVQVMSSDNPSSEAERNPSCCSQCFTTAFYQDVVFFELTESELKHVYPEARHLRDCVSAQSCLWLSLVALLTCRFISCRTIRNITRWSLSTAKPTSTKSSAPPRTLESLILSARYGRPGRVSLQMRSDNVVLSPCFNQWSSAPNKRALRTFCSQPDTPVGFRN